MTVVKQSGSWLWLWVYPPGRAAAYASHDAIVMEQNLKTPRSQTLEKAHMERNLEAYSQEAKDSRELYGALLREGLQKMIVPWDGNDPFKRGRCWCNGPTNATATAKCGPW